MNIRYIYIHHDDMRLRDSQWTYSVGYDDARLQALHHASNVMRSVLVVERDMFTGYMSPLGFAAL